MRGDGAARFAVAVAVVALVSSGVAIDAVGRRCRCPRRRFGRPRSTPAAAPGRGAARRAAGGPGAHVRRDPAAGARGLASTGCCTNSTIPARRGTRWRPTWRIRPRVRSPRCPDRPGHVVAARSRRAGHRGRSSGARDRRGRNGRAGARASRFFRYRLAGGERRALDPRSRPRCPRVVAGDIVTILGLSNALRFTDPIHRSPRRAGSRTARSTDRARPRSAPSACGAASEFAGAGDWTADEVGREYRVNVLFDAGLTGQDRRIALLELAASRASDTAKYVACFGLRNVVKVVAVDGGGSADPRARSRPRSTSRRRRPRLRALDRLGYEAPNTGAGQFERTTAIVPRTGQIVSTSWGDCESDVASRADSIDAMQTVFQQAAARARACSRLRRHGFGRLLRRHPGTTSESLEVDHPPATRSSPAWAARRS